MSVAHADSLMPEPHSDAAPGARIGAATKSSCSSGARVDQRGDEHERPALLGGRYRVQRQLGRGGMGAIYLVEDRSTGQQVALKQLHPEAQRQHGAHAVTLFEREFYTLAQLSHPHIITVYDYGHDPAGPFYTMELLDGQDLKALSPLEPKRACRVMHEVCSSLSLLHSRRLVHRDISPRNIRCTRDGRAKLIDFGAMLPMGPCTHSVGTPAFVAPEVLHHAALDARSDLFSLGATLYYALTGRAPFAAQRFADLRDAWAEEPPPPSFFTPSVPPSLDALCAALLQIDPAARPGSAFEVMQRLAAIGGFQDTETFDVSHAYLATPVLTGRELPLRRFVRAMRRALHGAGSAIRFESAPGLGRSRMLDACVLEAKTLGAVVLRSAPSTQGRRLAIAEQLAMQLLHALPDTARQAAAGTPLQSLLPPPDASGGALQLKVSSFDQHASLPALLTEWLLSATERHALLVVVDDIERVDEASVAWLASIARRAPEHRLLIACALETGARRTHAGAYAVLAANSVAVTLPLLSRDEAGALLSSMFGDVPNLTILNDRVYKLALGNPRDTLTLVQHLIDQRTIRYDGGRWALPSALAADALPEGATGALQARVAALPPLSRELAEAQALLGVGALRWQDYEDLVPHATRAEIDQALAELLAQQIFTSDGRVYGLSHRVVADALRSRLSEEQRRRLHMALYAFRQRRGESHPYVLAPHLFAAGKDIEALDLLANCEELLDRADGLQELLLMDRNEFGAMLEHALQRAIALDRPAREQHELRRKLIALAASGSPEIHPRHAALLLRRLEQDTGLTDYRQSDPSLPTPKRLEQALTAAMQRYAATPPRERVYTIEEALKHLASYVACSIAVAFQSADTTLHLDLPGLLEPFVSLSPALDALFQHSLATTDLACFARPVSANRRFGALHEQLKGVSNETMRYASSIRHAVAVALGTCELWQSLARAEAWADTIDEGPHAGVYPAYIRRLSCLLRGDFSGAARHAATAEVRTLQLPSFQIVEKPWYSELIVMWLLGDIAGIKHVLEGVHELERKSKGWLHLRQLAEGQLAYLRGDLERAHDVFERCLLDTDPSGQPKLVNHGLFCQAASGLIVTLRAQDRIDEAVELGDRSLMIARERGVELLWHAIARELALSLAARGELGRATTLIDAVIEEQAQLGSEGLHLALQYAARAQIAVFAGDSAGATHYAQLAAQQCGGHHGRAAGSLLKPLLERARVSGLELGLAPSEFAVSVLGSTATEHHDQTPSKASALLLAAREGAPRRMAALQWLCEQSAADSGQLYLVNREGALEHVASVGERAPDAESLDFACGFFAQQIDDDDMSAFTQATHMLSMPGAALFTDGRGQQHRLFLLTSKYRGELHYAGLAVLRETASGRGAANLLDEGRALATALLQLGETPGVTAGALTGPHEA